MRSVLSNVNLDLMSIFHALHKGSRYEIAAEIVRDSSHFCWHHKRLVGGTISRISHPFTCGELRTWRGLAFLFGHTSAIGHLCPRRSSWSRTASWKLAFDSWAAWSEQEFSTAWGLIVTISPMPMIDGRFEGLTTWTPTNLWTHIMTHAKANSGTLSRRRGSKRLEEEEGQRELLHRVHWSVCFYWQWGMRIRSCRTSFLQLIWASIWLHFFSTVQPLSLGQWRSNGTPN